MRTPTPSYPQVTLGRIALSDSEETEKFADSLGAHFQPVNDPSEPAVIAMVDKALKHQRLLPQMKLS